MDPAGRTGHHPATMLTSLKRNHLKQPAKKPSHVLLARILNPFPVLLDVEQPASLIYLDILPREIRQAIIKSRLDDELNKCRLDFTYDTRKSPRMNASTLTPLMILIKYLSLVSKAMCEDTVYIVTKNIDISKKEFSDLNCNIHTMEDLTERWRHISDLAEVEKLYSAQMSLAIEAIRTDTMGKAMQAILDRITNDPVKRPRRILIAIRGTILALLAIQFGSAFKTTSAEPLRNGFRFYTYTIGIGIYTLAEQLASYTAAKIDRIKREEYLQVSGTARIENRIHLYCCGFLYHYWLVLLWTRFRYRVDSVLLCLAEVLLFLNYALMVIEGLVSS